MKVTLIKVETRDDGYAFVARYTKIDDEPAAAEYLTQTGEWLPLPPFAHLADEVMFRHSNSLPGCSEFFGERIEEVHAR